MHQCIHVSFVTHFQAPRCPLSISFLNSVQALGFERCTLSEMRRRSPRTRNFLPLISRFMGPELPHNPLPIVDHYPRYRPCVLAPCAEISLNTAVSILRSASADNSPDRSLKLLNPLRAGSLILLIIQRLRISQLGAYGGLPGTI